MPKIMWGLFILETPLTIACLVLFALASPDTYRTRLWQVGSDHHFNSNPNEVLYSFANYKPIHTPLVWSRLYVLAISYIYIWPEANILTA